MTKINMATREAAGSGDSWAGAEVCQAEAPNDRHAVLCHVRSRTLPPDGGREAAQSGAAFLRAYSQTNGPAEKRLAGAAEAARAAVAGEILMAAVALSGRNQVDWLKDDPEAWIRLAPAGTTSRELGDSGRGPARASAGAPGAGPPETVVATGSGATRLIDSASFDRLVRTGGNAAEIARDIAAEGQFRDPELRLRASALAVAVIKDTTAA